MVQLHWAGPSGDGVIGKRACLKSRIVGVRIPLAAPIAESSSGRTLGLGPNYGGSNPPSAATTRGGTAYATRLGRVIWEFESLRVDLHQGRLMVGRLPLKESMYVRLVPLVPDVRRAQSDVSGASGRTVSL